MNRLTREKFFKRTCQAVTWLSVMILALLVIQILYMGISWINVNFITGLPSRIPSKAGLWTALLGTVWVISLTALFSIPLGVAAGVYLAEYQKKSKFRTLIEINIANLAGVPSVIYGLLGLALFVRTFGFGRSLLAGSMTLSLLVIPIVIMSTQEAILAIPKHLRLASYGLGATRWQTVRDQILPAALPGILTGIILSLSRAIGETAPLIIIGAFSYVAFVPESAMDQFTTIPIQIFNWSSRPQAGFHHLAAAAIIVLLVFLFFMNFIAIWLRARTQKRFRW